MDISLEARFAAIVKVILRSGLVEYDELSRLEEEATVILTGVVNAKNNDAQEEAVEKLVAFLKPRKIQEEENEG